MNCFRRVVSFLCSIFLGISFLVIPGFAYDAEHEDTVICESELEQAYIKLVEAVESRGEEVLLSYDSFVDNYSGGDLDQYTYSSIQDAIEMAKMEPESIEPTKDNNLELTVPTAIPSKIAELTKQPDIENAYNYLKNKYPYLEGSLTEFTYSYSASGAKSIDAFISEIEEAQPKDMLVRSVLDKWYENTGTTLPQRADYSQNGLLKTAKKGDLVYENGLKYSFTGHISTVEGIFYSSTYKQFYIRVIEAISKGVKRSVLDDTRAKEFKSHILRPCSANGYTITERIINNAVKFCQNQVGKKYGLDIFAHPDHSPSEDSWYCSELAWASYYNQGIDLDTTSGAYINEAVGVTPLDIFNSVFTYEIDYTNSSVSFSDVPPTHWAASSITYVAKNGLMSGTGNGKFSPSIKLNRGMFVTVLYRVAATPTVFGSHSFLDVPSSAYYSIPVAWATNNGIVNGTSATTFAPTQYITREQLVTMLYRFAKINGLNTSTGSVNLSNYADAGSISGFAVIPMKWAISKGIIKGTSSSTLSPKSTCSRAEAAVFVKRFMSIVTNDLTYPDPNGTN